MSRVSITLLCCLGIGCLPFAACTRPVEQSGPDNVLVVLVDTLRADRLGCYGYDRATSPRIDRMAAAGVLFEHAVSVAPWTNPAIASLFTGRHPREVLPPARHRDAVGLALPQEVETLAERFQNGGHRTIGLVDHPGISVRQGFAQGFDEFVQLHQASGSGPWEDSGTEFVRQQVRVAIEGAGDLPFFLYLHLIYPHRPYTAPAPYGGMFGPEAPGKRYGRVGIKTSEKMINAYDAEVRRTDDIVGDLLEDLESLGVDHRTWVTLVSDHGEGFGEHQRREHGNSFFDELLRVPLVLLPPRGHREPLRVSDPVSTVDLFPTILEMGGLAVPDGLPGSSLLRFLDGTTAKPGFLFSESPHSGDIEGAAVRSGPWKFIAYESGERPSHLFHLGNDSAEVNDLTEGEGEQRARLREELERHLIAVDRNRVALGAVEAGEADEETLERLRALGYVD